MHTCDDDLEGEIDHSPAFVNLSYGGDVKRGFLLSQTTEPVCVADSPT